MFAYGDAGFHGSLGDVELSEHIVAGTPTSTGRGYWLVGTGGGVFAFGDAKYQGSVSATADEPVVDIAVRPDGGGYWLATSPGGVAALGPPVPSHDGAGQRIVYSNSQQRIWMIDATERIADSYLVSGRENVPAVGQYRVFSKSRTAWAGHDGITMEYMVRFTRSTTSGIPIGFHSIPKYGNGSPMQTAQQLGTYRSAGCVRQRDDKAAVLYDWAPVGMPVVVVS